MIDKAPPPDDAWPPHRGKRGSRGAFGLQLRLRDRERANGRPIGAYFRDWTPGWKRYATERQRDEALAVLNRKDPCFEWRARPA